MHQVIVLFEVNIKDGKMEDYLKQASQLKENLKYVKGFIRAERFTSLQTEGKLLSLTVWENEESIQEWRNFEKHRKSQKKGREEDFEDYQIIVLRPIRQYGMNQRQDAPVDSNHYFKVE